MPWATGRDSFVVIGLNRDVNFEALIISSVKNPRDGYKLHNIIVTLARKFSVIQIAVFRTSFNTPP